MSQMTLDEKISQMHGTNIKNKIFRIVVGVPRLGIPDLLVTNRTGGVWTGGPRPPGEGDRAPLPAVPWLRPGTSMPRVNTA